MGEAHEWDGSRVVAFQWPVWFPAWRSIDSGFQEAGETDCLSGITQCTEAVNAHSSLPSQGTVG